jgi:hypothetical protein
MHLFSASWDALPRHRAEGLAASVTIHIAAFTFLITVPAETPQLARNDTVVIQVPAEVAGIAAEASAGAAPVIEERDAPADFPDTVALGAAGITIEIGKIRRHQDVLFPFVTASLPLVDEVAQRQSTRSAVVNPFGRERTRSAFPPLTLSADERQRVIDRAWSRRTRWESFGEIAALLRKHDPGTGDAALLVRSHVDQNLLQPYFDGATRDPRFWVMLGLAADHAPFIEFLAGFIRDHPSSRTTTELLFMLDEFAQASRDAMLMLLSSDPQSVLRDTLSADPDAFQLAESLYRQYRDWARREGLVHTDAIRARFDDVRVGILRTIVATSPAGYGASDARYLLGLIQWDRNDVAGALRWWRDLQPDGRDAYRQTTAAIAREITRPGGATVSAISGILGAEYRRWLTFSQERLERFGYEFDTF